MMGEKVLVLTQDGGVGSMIRMVTEMEGLDVLVMSPMHFLYDGQNMRELCEVFSPEFVIYELIPPFKDYWDFFKEIETNFESAKSILLCSDKAFAESIRSEREASILPMPFEIEDLVSMYAEPRESRVRGERSN